MNIEFVQLTGVDWIFNENGIIIHDTGKKVGISAGELIKTIPVREEKKTLYPYSYIKEIKTVMFGSGIQIEWKNGTKISVMPWTYSNNRALKDKIRKAFEFAKEHMKTDEYAEPKELDVLSIDENTKQYAKELVEKYREHKMRCNVCGKIFCYTDADLEKNKIHAKKADDLLLSSAINGLFVNQVLRIDDENKRERELSKIVNYSKCPNCNSSDISEVTENETSIENKETSTPIVSVVDEMKKFKELLDLGIITQEEFDKKKKQLLDL